MDRNDFILACKQMRIYLFEWEWDIVDEYRFGRINGVPYIDRHYWWSILDNNPDVGKIFRQLIEHDGAVAHFGTNSLEIIVLADNYDEAEEIAKNYFKQEINTKANMQKEIEDGDNW